MPLISAITLGDESPCTPYGEIPVVHTNGQQTNGATLNLDAVGGRVGLRQGRKLATIHLFTKLVKFRSHNIFVKYTIAVPVVEG